MGLNQSTVGMWKNNSLINLHLLTGQIGKPGAGPFSLTGQPNAMGGREAGLLSHQLPGYRTVEDAQHRADAEAFWGRRPGTISPKVGLTAVEMFRALEKGQLKAIWIAGTNPGGQPAGPAPRPPGLAKGAARRRAGRLPSDRDDALGRCHFAGGAVGRKRMDQHQQRTHGQLQPQALGRARRSACPTGRSSPALRERWVSRASTTRPRARSGTNSSR